MGLLMCLPDSGDGRVVATSHKATLSPSRFAPTAINLHVRFDPPLESKCEDSCMSLDSLH